MLPPRLSGTRSLRTIITLSLHNASPGGQASDGNTKTITFNDYDGECVIFVLKEGINRGI